MNRSDFIRYLGLLSAGAGFAPAAISRWQSPFTELRMGVGTFSMQGGTIGWFVNDDAVIVVDSQFPDPASQFLSGIVEFGSGQEKVLFNTHHHGDHTGGNQVFEHDGYRIIAHEHVPMLQERSARANETVEHQAYAETVFDRDYELSAGDETIYAAYYGPAHTKGDSVIWFRQANIAHMGDLVFNRRYPFIDRDGGALITGWIDLLETVYSRADSETLFIFGHGNPEFGVTGNRDDLLYMRNFLLHLLEYTHQGIQEGKSREELTQIDHFEEFPDHESPSDFLSLPRNIDVAWRELTDSE
jgi:cyclase